MNTKDSWMNKFLAGLAVSVLVVTVALAAGDLRFNLTPSHPRGLYRLVAEIPGRGDYVMFCLAPENPWSGLAARRGYLGRGRCPSGLTPLLKILAGLSGDSLEIQKNGLVLNGRFLPGTARPVTDSQGRELPPSSLASGPIPVGLALVLSQENPGSFDSRHFGLIPLRALRKAEPVLTF